MDDTVNRLRIWADGMEKQKNVVVSVLMTEAADEIERLRKERDEARREVCGMNESGLRMNDSDKQREANNEDQRYS